MSSAHRTAWRCPAALSRVSVVAWLATASAVVGLPSTGHAQRELTVKVSSNAVARRDSSACVYSMGWLPPLPPGPPPSPPAEEDRIVIGVYQDSLHATRAAPPTDLRILLDGKEVGVITPTDPPADKTLYVGKAGLVDRILTVWQRTANDPLCSVSPFPRRPSFAQTLAFVTHTDVIASGEISNSLRTGATNDGATGTLGFHHISFLEAGATPRRFPWLFSPDGQSRNDLIRWLYRTSMPMDGEDLRAVITVAGTRDSVTGPGRSGFAQAVLFPAWGASGGGKSVNLEYYPFVQFGRHQSIGPLFRIAANQSLWAPDSLPTKADSVAVSPTNPAHHWSSRNAVAVAFDARIRAILINRVSDSDENSLSFALDIGYINRRVGGDVVARSNRGLYYAATGDSTRRVFSGWVLGTYLRLRQVTAFADFQCLRCRFLWIHGRESDDPTVPFFEQLEGLQPIIGFRFEAPFFSVRH